MRHVAKTLCRYDAEGYQRHSPFAKAVKTLYYATCCQYCYDVTTRNEPKAFTAVTMQHAAIHRQTTV